MGSFVRIIYRIEGREVLLLWLAVYMYYDPEG
jgi:hypothetical protein